MDKSYDISTYGERCADAYDDLYPTYEEATIATLVELAHAGRVLELGIGTGRIALPLAMKGVEIHGIDASPAMIAQLQAKPGGQNIPVTLGNFADVGVEDKYALIFVVFNTFYCLLSQEEQVRCFHNVARHLSKDGVFLLEAFVPDVTRFSGAQSVRATQVTIEMVNLDVSLHDRLQQRVTAQHVLITEEGIHFYPIEIRYAWPSELDLMAQLAGLRLLHRWGSWQQEPFTSNSEKHISVYGWAT